MIPNLLLGYGILALPFIFLFLWVGRDHGLKEAIIFFVTLVILLSFILACTYFGVSLILKK